MLLSYHCRSPPTTACRHQHCRTMETRVGTLRIISLRYSQLLCLPDRMLVLTTTWSLPVPPRRGWGLNRMTRCALPLPVLLYPVYASNSESSSCRGQGVLHAAALLGAWKRRRHVFKILLISCLTWPASRRDALEIPPFSKVCIKFVRSWAPLCRLLSLGIALSRSLV